MVPTGLHGLFGFFLVSRIRPNHKLIRIGLVWGSVIPDLDLFGSALILLISQNKKLTIAFHRSITHSLVIMTILITIGFLTSIKWQKGKIVYFPFITGVVTGMFFHTFFDLFYLDGVTLFWPIQPFGNRITMTTFTYDTISPIYNSFITKMIATLDAHFEIVYYMTFFYFSNKYRTDRNLIITYRSRMIVIKKWPDKMKKISIYFIFQMIFFLLMTIISIYLTFIDLDTFIILLYIPILPFYLFSLLLPLLMRNTITHIGIDAQIDPINSIKRN